MARAALLVTLAIAVTVPALGFEWLSPNAYVSGIIKKESSFVEGEEGQSPPAGQSTTERCIRNGQYSNPDDCGSYIQCSNGLQYIMPCPLGLHYSEETQRCESKCDAHCDETLACDCKWESCKGTCALPKDEGPCFGHFLRYYFNKDTGQCQEFIYGGCKGNLNNYKTIQECEKACTEREDSCSLPKYVGPCKGYVPRYYFNQLSGRCEEFIYGGCEGNSNNFEIKEQCEKMCESSNDYSKKASKNPTKSFLTEDFACIKDGFYRNPEDCKSYIHCSNGQKYVQPCPSGLHFSVETERCESPCEAYCDQSIAEECGWLSSVGDDICNLPPEYGPCDKHEIKWYYNRRVGECHRFTYGGCGGNANRFNGKLECYARCSHARDPEWTPSLSDLIAQNFTCILDGKYENPEDCSTFIQCSNGLPYVQPCPGGLHFSQKTKRCESPCDAECDKSLAEECGWNEYVTRGSVLTPSKVYPIAQDFTCILDGVYKNPEDCSTFIQCSNGLPYVQPCPAGLHFSQETERCESPCEAECDENLAEQCGWNEDVTRMSSADDICRLSPDKGRCDVFQKRWYFDSSMGECREFFYSGCRGNANNFRSKRDCENRCLRVLRFDKESFDITSYAPFTEPFTEDDECVKDGLYTNSENCSTFIQCSNGQSYVQPCPSGLHFSEETERCESPCKAHCDDSLGEQCGWTKQLPRGTCHLPYEVGPCQARMPRFFFDTSKRECRLFYYGGCKGNANNFRTMDECEGKCSSFKDHQISADDSISDDFNCTKDGLYQNPENCTSFIQCSNGLPYVQLCRSGLHFSVETQRCESPCDAHCDQGIADECGWEEKNTKNGFCQLPYEVGPCRARIPRFYYDVRKGSCMPFYYGGCKGNSNNFRTMKECQEKCFSFENHCNKDGLYQNPGDCKSFIHCSNGKSYVQLCPSGLHFSVETERCESPCDAHCDQSISDECGWDKENRIIDVCYMHAEKGPCKSSFKRYYYDFNTKSCTKFEYGGCEGNANNFNSLEDCRNRCPDTGDYSRKSLKFSTGDFEDFTCVKDGLFHEPEDCESYIQCSNGQKYVRPCPSGLHFSVETQRCESPCDAHCDQSIAQECGWNEYIKPTEYSWFKFRNIPDSNQQIPTEDPITMSSEFNCIKDGLYPDPKDCERFIQCTNGWAVGMPCPRGLHFSEKSQRCESSCDAHCNTTIACQCGWPECSEIDVDCEAEPLVGPCKGSIRRYFYDRDSGRCKRFTYGGCGGNTNNFLTEHECSEKCQKKLVGDYRCPSPYGKFANFFDCVSYYECKRDNPIIKRCPSGTAFDHIKSKCVSEATVRCMFTCQEQDSVYSYLPDCSKYIECVNGINKPKKCPPGQVFDRRIKSCADENTVPCPKY